MVDTETFVAVCNEFEETPLVKPCDLQCPQPAPRQHCFGSYVMRMRLSVQETNGNLMGQCCFHLCMWRDTYFNSHLIQPAGTPFTYHLTTFMGNGYTNCICSFLSDNNTLFRWQPLC
ncbi:hypothetical protein TNCV_2492441 [Trichonephila clavipes]|nr:hypothetical protein TNCV_2492441 [Trichonephila clavipes]